MVVGDSKHERVEKGATQRHSEQSVGADDTTTTTPNETSEIATHDEVPPISETM